MAASPEMPRPDPDHEPDSSDTRARRARRLLVCCDDVYHPGANVRAGLAPLVAEGRWKIDWLDGETLAAVRRPLDDYAVIVIAKSNVVSKEDAQAWLPPEDSSFTNYARAGGRVFFIHSGLAGFEQAPAVRQLAGGAFLQHPPACDVTLTARQNHPFASGLGDAFSVFDEHYLVVVDDPRAEIFLTARSVHGTQPAGWTRIEGRGRVCAITPGHFVDVWRHPAFQRLLRHALRWMTDDDGVTAPGARADAP